MARFVFWGKPTHYLTAPQPWDYASLGAGSVLERSLTLDGKILLLGCDHDTVTFLHYIEHVGDFPGTRVLRFQVPVVDDGRRVWRDMEEVNSGHAAHPSWPDRFFARIVDSFLVNAQNAGGRVGNAPSYMVRAPELFDFANHASCRSGSSRR